jgi:hypothetical protein
MLEIIVFHLSFIVTIKKYYKDMKSYPLKIHMSLKTDYFWPLIQHKNHNPLTVTKPPLPRIHTSVKGLLSPESTLGLRVARPE